MTFSSFDIYFNSGGQTGSHHYTDGNNVSLIEVVNSDEQYYQNGTIELFDTSTQVIGDSVMVFINDIEQFSGYISGRQQSINAGKRFESYNLIGKTYDLWRYIINDDTEYSGQTAFIASSMVSTFRDGMTAHISSDASGNWGGINIESTSDYSNMQIGEALIKLTELDGYSFYVDNQDRLHYFDKGLGDYQFTIEESDIIDMTSIEQSQGDIVNDCLVIGGDDYSSKTSISQSAPSSTVFPSGLLVAQSFEVENNTLSAIDIYLDRSLDPNQPGTLDFEIWETSDKLLFDTDFEDNSDTPGLSGTAIDSDNRDVLTLAYKTQYETYLGGIAYDRKGSKIGGGVNVDYKSCPHKVRVRQGTYGGGCNGEQFNLIFRVYTTDDSGEPSECIANTDVLENQTECNWSDYAYFTSQVYISANTNYVFTVEREDGNDIEIGYGGASPNTNGWVLNEGSWTKYDDEFPTMDIYIRHYSSNGVASSNVHEYETQYMKIDMDLTSSNCVTISGTNDNGTTWFGLTNGEWTDFGNESGDGTYIKYYLSSTGHFTPRIDTANLRIGDAKGSTSSVPVSSNKLEWSDDISWTATNIPYPPQYSGWKTYSSPKLSGLTVGRDYWLVFQYPSSNNQWWSYFYDHRKSYDGEILYSWTGGGQGRWSSNSDTNSWGVGDPSERVPSGNMKFKLGWEKGPTSARAINHSSIDKFGRHFKKVSEPTYNTLSQVQTRAEYEISGMTTVPRKGSVTIEGREDMDIGYRFSSNFINFDVAEIWNIAEYVQRIDKNGFTTTIQYNKHKFDIAREMARLKTKMDEL